MVEDNKKKCAIFETFVTFSILSPLIHCFGSFPFFFPLDLLLRLTCVVLKLIFMLLHSNAVGDGIGIY